MSSSRRCSETPRAHDQWAAETFDQLEHEARAFFDEAEILHAEARLVKKAIRAAGVARDEAMALGRIEPAHCACCQRHYGPIVRHATPRCGKASSPGYDARGGRGAAERRGVDGVCMRWSMTERKRSSPERVITYPSAPMRRAQSRSSFLPWAVYARSLVRWSVGDLAMARARQRERPT